MYFRYRSSKANDSFQNLFGHVRTRIFIQDNLYLDIGRFSSTAIKCLRLFSNARFTGLAATIGDLCEFADAEIILGGEHKNNEVVNFNFSASPVFQKLLLSNGVDVHHHRKGPITVGDGVIVSQGAKILSGVSLGDGAVIAAGSIVATDCEEFGIYGGAPAKRVKDRGIDRKQFEDFFRFSVAAMYQSLTGKPSHNEFETEADKHSRAVVRIQFLDSEKGGTFGYQIHGILRGEQFYPIRAGSAFHRYCMQASLPAESEIDWFSNPLTLEM